MTRRGKYIAVIGAYVSVAAILVAIALSTTNAGSTERVYFRGLSFPNPCGNVFADGLNEMAKNSGDISYSWCSRASVVKGLIARKKAGTLDEPVHIVGHSLGANSALIAANDLRKAGIKVGFVGAFDPTVQFKIIQPGGTFVYLSNDFRARPQLGAVNELFPEHNHLSITKDKNLQKTIKENTR